MSARVRTNTLQKNTLYWVDLVCCCVVSYFLGTIVKKVHTK